MIRRELKETFLRELTASEKAYFLRTAREATTSKLYCPSEDLFHYCYFMTVKERMKTISASRGNGMLRVLLVEGTKDIDDALKMYTERLEQAKGAQADPAAQEFIEYMKNNM